MVKQHKNEYQDAIEHPTSLDDVLAPTPPSASKVRGKAVLAAAGVTSFLAAAVGGGPAIANTLKSNPRGGNVEMPGASLPYHPSELHDGGFTANGQRVQFDAKNRAVITEAPKA